MTAIFNRTRIIALTLIITAFFAPISYAAGTPIVSTVAPSGIGSNGATLNGTVDPQGADTSYWFEYGSNSYLGTVTGSQSVGFSSGTQNVSLPVFNLSPNTTYSYHLVARNQYGTTYGTVMSFTTTNGYSGGGSSSNCNSTYNPYYSYSATVPCVQTNMPNNIGDTYATFNAYVNPSGADTTAWFEYGTNPSALNITTETKLIQNFNNVYNLSAGVTGLNTGTSYYVRVAARNQYGIVYGQPFQFLTTGSGGGAVPVYGGGSPLVTTRSAGYVPSTNTVLLNGTLSPQGMAGSAWFEYGTTASLGQRTSEQSFASGAGDITMVWSVSGLPTGIDYYYRAAVRTSAGLAYGSILTFRFGTLAAPARHGTNPPPPAAEPASSAPPKLSPGNSDGPSDNGGAKESPLLGGASLISIFGGSALPWLLLLLILSFEAYRFFAKKEEKKKTAKEKIQASLSSEMAQTEKRP